MTKNTYRLSPIRLVFTVIVTTVILAVTVLCVGWTNRDIRLWKHTPAWNLALAVKHQNVANIQNIVKMHPELLNYQEPQNGFTLLIWAVGNEKFQSAEALLRCGANPNVRATRAGETALFEAAGTSRIHHDAHLYGLRVLIKADTLAVRTSVFIKESKCTSKWIGSIRKSTFASAISGNATGSDGNGCMRCG